MALSPFATSDLMGRRLEERRCRQKLFYFQYYSWPHIDPQPLRWNWHLGAMAEHLQAVTEQEIFRLIITVPPGFAKSLSAAVQWPAWEWIEHPEEQSLIGSYDEGLVFRDANKTKDLITSEWYLRIFRPSWELRKNQNAASFYVNTKGGNRKGFYIGGRAKTGWRGRKIVLDDSLAGDDRYNVIVKTKTWDTISKVLPTRFNDPATAAWLLMGQRLVSDDMVGRMLALPGKGGFTELCLPARYDPDRKCRTQVRFDKAALWPMEAKWKLGADEPRLVEGFEDPRTEPGEPLFPEMYPEAELKAKEDILGEDDFSAQFQQAPSDSKNKRFSEADFRHWTWVSDPESNAPLISLVRPDGSSEMVRLDMCWTFASCDFAVSEDKRADYTVVLDWAVTPKSDMILLGMFRERMTEPDLVAWAVNHHSKKNHQGTCHSLWVCGGNGIDKPVVQNLVVKGIPVLSVPVHTDKFVNSVTASVRLKLGQVYFPQKSDAPWMRILAKELVDFPGEKDDCVDAFSCGAKGLYDGAIAGLLGGSPSVSLRKPGEGRRTAEDILASHPRPSGTRQRLGLGG